MLSIKNFINNIIDLNGVDEYDNDFVVDSVNDNNGKEIPFNIDVVTNKNIYVTIHAVNSIRIYIDVEFITAEEYIVLRNINGEKLVITVKPNEYMLAEKEYKFKITKAEIQENGDLKLRILSKMNKTELGWRCIYNGKPLNYKITPMESNKSSYVNVKLLSIMLSDYISKLVFEQDESGEKTSIKILNTTEGMEIYEKNG